MLWQDDLTAKLGGKINLLVLNIIFLSVRFPDVMHGSINEGKPAIVITGKHHANKNLFIHKRESE